MAPFKQETQNSESTPNTNRRTVLKGASAAKA